MSNNFIDPKEATKRVLRVIKKHSAEYQEKTGCSENEKHRLEHAIAVSLVKK